VLSAQARHLGRPTGLIDEDEPGRIEVGRRDAPAPRVRGAFSTSSRARAAQSLTVLRPMRMDRAARNRSTIRPA